MKTPDLTFSGIRRLVKRASGWHDPTKVHWTDVPEVVLAMRDATKRTSYMQNPNLNYLFWECTLRCNLKCKHCGSSCDGSAPPGELGTQQVLDVFQTICEDFDTKNMTLAITGGEPLIRPDLEEVTQFASKAGMRVGMVTNATLATVPRVRDLVRCGMSIASVSIDGPAALHDAVRGEGSFARTMAGVAALKEGGIRSIEIITCVRPANLPFLDETWEIVRQTGAFAWRLITIDKMGRAADPAAQDLWLQPPDVVKLLDYIQAKRKHTSPKQIPHVSFSCGGYLGTEHEFRVRPADRQCYAGLCIASLLYDGSVSACPSLPRSMIQGSVLQERFSTIWKTQFQQHRQTEWRKTGPCAECKWFGVCLGGGLHERLAQPDEYCWLERQKLPRT